MRQDFVSCRFSFIMGVEVFLCMKYPKFLNEKYNTIGGRNTKNGVPYKNQTEGDWKRQPGTGLKTMRTRYDFQAHKSNLELLLFFYPIWTISS